MPKVEDSLQVIDHALWGPSIARRSARATRAPTNSQIPQSSGGVNTQTRVTESHDDATQSGSVYTAAIPRPSLRSVFFPKPAEEPPWIKRADWREPSMSSRFVSQLQKYREQKKAYQSSLCTTSALHPPSTSSTARPLDTQPSQAGTDRHVPDHGPKGPIERNSSDASNRIVSSLGSRSSDDYRNSQLQYIKRDVEAQWRFLEGTGYIETDSEESLRTARSHSTFRPYTTQDEVDSRNAEGRSIYYEAQMRVGASRGGSSDL